MAVAGMGQRRERKSIRVQNFNHTMQLNLGSVMGCYLLCESQFVSGHLLAAYHNVGASYSNGPHCPSVCLSVCHANISETKRDRHMSTRKRQ